MNYLGFANLKVKDILAGQLLTCLPNESLQKVAQKMTKSKRSSILVVDNDEVLGIWSEHEALLHDFSIPLQAYRTVNEVMSSPVKQISGEMNLPEVTERFHLDGFRHYLAVDEQGQRLGIISYTDVVMKYNPDAYLVPRLIGSVVKPTVPRLLSTTSISEAAAVMRRAHVDAAVIIFPDGGYGLLTESDIVSALASGITHPKVEQFASPGLISLPENASLIQAKTKMAELNIFHLGVTNQANVLIGIINLADMLYGLRQSYNGDHRHLLDQHEATLAISHQELQLAYKIIGSSLEGVIITDKNLQIEFCNPSFMTITGYEQQEIIGKKPSILSSGRHGAAFYDAMWRQINAQGYWQGEIWNRRKNGEIYPELLTITAIHAEEGKEVIHYTGIFSDITQSKTDEEQIRQLAFYDPLTGLANRRRMLDRLNHELALSLRHQSICALLYFDLDHFKTINDTLGHGFGDAVLCETANRLTAILRDTDTLARLGGDEFVAIMPGLGELKELAINQAQNIAEKIQKHLNLPYWIEGQEVFLAASIGITLFPENTNDALELLRQADTAMYRAKEEGRNQIRFYQKSMQEAANLRFLIIDGLRHALQNHGFFLYYQPQLDDSGRLIGAEALLRWRHPERGDISPAQFIPIAEESNLIVPIGDWVLNAALLQLRQWNRSGFYLPKLAINISLRQFFQKGFIENISSAIARYGIDPKQLTLEITEGLLLDNVEEAIKRMTLLKQMGFSFSVDDFGTGFSSLSYLHNLPLDQLKIDKSFVQGISNGHGKTVIVDTIIAMAKHLGFGVIAEGVENQVELEFLKNSGCLQYQGYYFSPPLPSEAFLTFCQANPSSGLNQNG